MLRNGLLLISFSLFLCVTSAGAAESKPITSIELAPIRSQPNQGALTIDDVFNKPQTLGGDTVSEMKKTYANALVEFNNEWKRTTNPDKNTIKYSLQRVKNAFVDFHKSATEFLKRNSGALTAEESKLINDYVANNRNLLMSINGSLK